MRSTQVAASQSRVAVGILQAAVAAAMVACDAEAPRGPGAISVTANATSAEPAFFEYGIAIDSGTPRTAFLGQPLAFLQPGLSHGKHVVTVTGASAACSGRDPQEVELRGDDTAKVTVAISCPRTTGDLSVSVSTTGQDIDTNGYYIAVDGVVRGFVTTSGSTLMRYLGVGSHTVALGDVASNCTASAAQGVTLAAGTTVAASFTVTCTPVALLKFVTTITGSDRDPDGYSLKVGTLASTQIKASSTTIVRVTPGTIDYSLGDVQPNCALGGAATGSVTVAGGDTATVNVSATCSVIPTGSAGTSITDPANDTITSTFTGSTTPHDIRTLSTRYAPGWITLVLRFGGPILAGVDTNPQGLYGQIDLDVDESSSTGGPPLANAYGASASMGSDYAVLFFFSDSVSAAFAARTGLTYTSAGQVRTKYAGDSVVVQIPLNKMNGDDGAMGIVTVVGTVDRPTDVAPNTGVMLARPPASPILAESPRRAHATLPFAGRTTPSIGAPAVWAPKPR